MIKQEETLAALWEIVQKVAAEEPTYDTCMGDIECVYQTRRKTPALQAWGDVTAMGILP